MQRTQIKLRTPNKIYTRPQYKRFHQPLVFQTHVTGIKCVQKSAKQHSGL